MKVKEIMLDDLVEIQGVVAKVTKTTMAAICSSEINDMCAVTPIVLTYEILDKNGWIKGNHIYDAPKDKPFRLGICSNCFYTQVGFYTQKIAFVHELQHALRLCGLNELADNLKV